MEERTATATPTCRDVAYGQAIPGCEAASLNDLFADSASAKVRPMSPLSKRETPNEADVAWAAGFFDGEGCVHIARQTYGKQSSRRPTYRLAVSVSQTRLATLHEFEWAVGFTGTYGKPKPTKKQTRMCYALNYHGVTAYKVLERLSEFLRRKEPQAQLAKEFRAECKIHVHPGPNGQTEKIWRLRRWYYERMRMLNKEG
jgi:hypothetical protein